MAPANELKYRLVFTYHDEVSELNVDILGAFDKRKATEEAVAGIISPGDAPEVTIERLYRLRYLHRGKHRVHGSAQLLLLLWLSLSRPCAADSS
jgi:hypothetical protein